MMIIFIVIIVAMMIMMKLIDCIETGVLHYYLTLGLIGTWLFTHDYLVYQCIVGCHWMILLPFQLISLISAKKYYFTFFDKYKLWKTHKCNKLNEQIHQISPCIVRQDEVAVLCSGNISSSFSTDTNNETNKCNKKLWTNTNCNVRVDEVAVLECCVLVSETNASCQWALYPPIPARHTHLLSNTAVLLHHFDKNIIATTLSNAKNQNKQMQL